MNWIKSLFGFAGYKPTAPAKPEQVELPGRRQADTQVDPNADLFEKGCVFSARVSLDTPLAALRRHGERFDGHPNDAPYVCSDEYGSWGMISKTWRSLGIDVDEFKPSHASPIGPVDPADVMPFLIAFREIVETAPTHEQRIARLLEMGRQPQHKEYWDRFSKAYDDFPHSHFYFPLTALPGVGRKTAKALYEAGFRSVSDIHAAPPEKLEAIPGLGKASVAKIKAAPAQ